MAAQRWYVGQRVRAAVTFTDINGQRADPSTVVAKFEDGAGLETTRTYPTGITKTATGQYFTDIDVSNSGTWSVRWNGTGDLVAAVEESFVVQPTKF